MKSKPLVLEIKGNSLDDGPGIRSVVFMKGCPLSCVWCHNPESKKTGAELSYDAKKCIGCNTCAGTCERYALSKENEFFINRSSCDLCFECTDACPSEALEQVGREMTIDGILDLVLKDKPFFDTSGGGVTMSGGEPTLHMEFCSEILKALKSQGIHTLVETCGQFDYQRFQTQILPYTDTIYFDIKFIDSDLHKKYCGLTNKTILDNFTKLNSAAKAGGFNLLPRTPLIPEITDTEENIRAIADFLSRLEVSEARLMAYNPLWHEKNDKIGEKNPVSQIKAMQKWMARNNVRRCEDIFKSAGIGL